MGAKKRPFYRLVVADARSPRDGRFIEAIGTYDPLANPAVVRVDAERVKEWMSKGAKPTDIARQLLVREGVLEHTGPRYEKVEKGAKPSKKQVAKARAAEEAAAQPAPEPIVDQAATEAPAAPEAEAAVEEAPAAEADVAAEAPADEAAPAEVTPAEPEAAAEASAEVEPAAEAGAEAEPGTADEGVTKAEAPK
jgi:small subunit ribosomal protein S16